MYLQPSKPGLILLLLTCLSTGHGLDVSCKLGEVTEHKSDLTTEHTITVHCAEATMTFILTEGPASFELKLEDGNNGVKLLGVEHRNGDVENDLFITIDGETFNVKDGMKKEDDELIMDLLKSPAFRYFTQSVKVIHDELELKGWESPVVMLLYNLALSAERLATAERLRDGSSQSLYGGAGPEAWFVDPRTWHYHGLSPSRKCKLNGWYTLLPYFTLKQTDCLGICGPGCHTCWKFVCGDCCYHTGCKRHDKFCSGPEGYKACDCVTMRGVLWDTLTDTARDC